MRSAGAVRYASGTSSFPHGGYHEPTREGYIIFSYISIKNKRLKVYFVPLILLTTCEVALLTDAYKKPWSFPQVRSGLHYFYPHQLLRRYPYLLPHRKPEKTLDTDLTISILISSGSSSIGPGHFPDDWGRSVMSIRSYRKNPSLQHASHICPSSSICKPVTCV